MNGSAKWVLASDNRNKLREYREMLEGTGVVLIPRSEAGLTDEVEETGSTFEENAALKAAAAAGTLGLPVLADDSGLEVKALGGAPGVYSARYGGPGLTDAEKCTKLLTEMKGIEDRSARFVCAICCAFPDGRTITVRGEFPGLIAHAPRGENGFGYDPIFYLPEYGKTAAELAPAEKNGISHRGRALAALRKRLTQEDTTC